MAAKPESLDRRIAEALEEAIADGRTPGAICLVGRRTETLCLEAAGHRCLTPECLPMAVDTLFDVASLTKPVATATVIMQLTDRGVLSLQDPVARWLPDFTGDGREAVTVWHLLTHSSGLPAYRDYEVLFGEDLAPEERRAAVVRDICRLDLEHRAGDGSIYSCLGFILLTSVAEAATGRPLDALAQERIFEPLGMADTGFCPEPGLAPRCAATEEIAGGVLQGVVHDQNARYLGGVGGNAGLFSTAGDLAIFARMLLNGGALAGTRVLAAESVEAMLCEQSAAGAVRRTLGWRLANPEDTHLYGAPTADSVGHTGFTGTSLWIDRASGVFVVLLTNRVHPSRDAEIGPLRRRVGEIVSDLP
jgi:CubicO group peptidase (beta-lactamase class C family)